MQAAPSFSSLVILVIGLMFVAGLGWLVITYFTKHMTEMSEGEREDVNSNANRWALIGVLPSLGLSIALEEGQERESSTAHLQFITVPLDASICSSTCWICS